MCLSGYTCFFRFQGCSLFYDFSFLMVTRRKKKVIDFQYVHILLIVRLGEMTYKLFVCWFETDTPRR